MVLHRLLSLETPDLPEPDLSKTVPEDAVYGTELGDFGPDYRLIRSNSDIDARPGHKSAKGKSVAGFFFGYDLHLAVAVKAFHYFGDRAKGDFGPELLPFVLGLCLQPAGTNPAIAGLEAIAMALSAAPHIREVIADRAYTNKASTFNRELHKLGINVVMDYSKPEVKRHKVINIEGHEMRFHCGTCLHPWTPASMRKPPANLKDEALADWYTVRNRYYRYTETQTYDDGRKRMNCPVHDERVKIAATASTNARDVPLVPTPKGKITCCGGSVTMKLEQLDRYQNAAFGTRAWRRSYGRRNQVENVNKEIRRTSGLADESCKKFGFIAHLIAAAAAVCAHNIRQARKYREQAEAGDATTQDTAAETDTTPQDAPTPTGTETETAQTQTTEQTQPRNTESENTPEPNHTPTPLSPTTAHIDPPHADAPANRDRAPP
ncbi:hypothetical protein [Candidatus Poriferisodalis sp.]|uniref:hypothetical protein n=1 Tax=Candidatus Poriferisodalis sp. TaxID=3101277 RepID=UPI003C6F8B43